MTGHDVVVFVVQLSQLALCGAHFNSTIIMKQGTAAESTYIHSLCLCYLRYTASFINEKSGHSFLLLLVAILLVLKTSSHLRYKVLCTTTKVQSYKFSVRSCLLRLKSCLLHLRLESCLLGLSWIYQSRRDWSGWTKI